MNLSRTYRVTDREMTSMFGMRRHLRLSINQIAQVLNRSTATIHHYVKDVSVDNRRSSVVTRLSNAAKFRYLKGEIGVRVKMFLMGFFESIKEALICKNIPLATLDFLESENSAEEDEEDPA